MPKMRMCIFSFSENAHVLFLCLYATAARRRRAPFFPTPRVTLLLIQIQLKYFPRDGKMWKTGWGAENPIDSAMKTENGKKAPRGVSRERVFCDVRVPRLVCAAPKR